MKHHIKARAIIIKDNKIFLLRNIENGKFMTPGGKQEEGETIKQTLHREILEELGVKPVIERLIGFREYLNVYGELTIQFLFLVKNVEDFIYIDRESCSHGYEWDEYGFYSLEELIESKSNFPSDLEHIIDSALGKKTYNSIM